MSLSIPSFTSPHPTPPPPRPSPLISVLTDSMNDNHFRNLVRVWFPLDQQLNVDQVQSTSVTHHGSRSPLGGIRFTTYREDDEFGLQDILFCYALIYIYILNSFQSNEAEILQYCSCSTAVFVIFGWTVLTTTDAGVCVYSILQLCCFKPRPLFVFLQLRCEQDVNQSVSEMMLYWFGAELSDGEAPRPCVLLYASVLTFVCGFGGFFFYFLWFVCLFVCSVDFFLLSASTLIKLNVILKVRREKLFKSGLKTEEQPVICQESGSKPRHKPRLYGRSVVEREGRTDLRV